jgi:hypothetical protein
MAAYAPKRAATKHGGGADPKITETGFASICLQSRGKRRAELGDFESADSFQYREGRWHEDLVADARDDGSIALAVVADLVPSRIILERCPPRLAICQ